MLGVVLGVVGLYVALNPEEPLSAEQQELLAAVPPKVGSPCHRVELNDSPEHAFIRLVRARVECKPVDPGPDLVTFSLFTTEADQRQYLHQLGALWDREGFSCREDYLSREPWVDAGGEERGELLCADGSRRAVIAWSDDTNLLVGFASSGVKNEVDLHRWWQRSVKYEGDGIPRKAEAHLRSLLPASFGSCGSQREAVPGAVVAVNCEPGGGITVAGAALFPSEETLRRYIDTLSAEFSGKTDKGCNESTLSYTTYGPGSDGKPTQGMLLCYVSGGAQWFVWTAREPRVYAYAARDDESWSKLYDSWSHSLSSIEGIQ